MSALDVAHGDFSVDFADDGGVARVAGFEELGDAGQTAGDVACFTYGAGYLDEYVAGLEFLSVFDHDVTVDGEVVGAEDVAFLVEDVGAGYAALFLGLDDDALTQTGGFVFFDAVGDGLDDVLELDATCVLGDDDGVEGVPLGNDGALGDGGSLGDEEL